MVMLFFVRLYLFAQRSQKSVNIDNEFYSKSYAHLFVSIIFIVYGESVKRLVENCRFQNSNRTSVCPERSIFVLNQGVKKILPQAYM